MALYARLIGTEEPRIPIHAFIGALGEWERGKITRTQVVNGFTITTSSELADLDSTFAKIIPPPDSISFGAFVSMTNVGTTYDSIAASKGLGYARVEGSGISGVEFTVRYNKIGTGTLSWQLFDDTNSVEVGVIDDAAAAADNRQGTIEITPGSPLAAGLHTLRVRCKSTVAADDPVYYGAALRIRRVNSMFAALLHEVLLMGDSRIPPYDTEAAIKTRLGI